MRIFGSPLQRWTLAFLGTSCVCALDNGLYQHAPPMGWRSWNSYATKINEFLIRRVIDSMAEPMENEEDAVSLLELGYNNCGLDDAWQRCIGMGTDSQHFHNDLGRPMIDENSFNDLAKLVAYGQGRGLHMGWYLNNCMCMEHGPNLLARYVGDVQLLRALNFDGVKIDGCGDLLNMTRYMELLGQTGRPVMVENCHWGVCEGPPPMSDPNVRFSWQWDFSGDASSCPHRKPDGTLVCPMTTFRTSADIQTGNPLVEHATSECVRYSWLRNLQTTLPFLDADAPLAGAGCWAYPDMMVVGFLESYEWNRAHFGAWCVTSSPLILGLDVADRGKLHEVWGIIANKHAISVSQQFAGHPGWLVRSWTPASLAPASTRAEGHSCVKGPGASYNDDLDAMQVWTKPLHNGSAAVYVVNAHSASGAIAYSVTFAELRLDPDVEFEIFDIWAKRPAGRVRAVLQGEVHALDSHFLLLKPVGGPPLPPGQGSLSSDGAALKGNSSGEAAEGRTGALGPNKTTGGNRSTTGNHAGAGAGEGSASALNGTQTPQAAAGADAGEKSSVLAFVLVALLGLAGLLLLICVVTRLTCGKGGTSFGAYGRDQLARNGESHSMIDAAEPSETNGRTAGPAKATVKHMFTLSSAMTQHAAKKPGKPGRGMDGVGDTKRQAFKRIFSLAETEPAAPPHATVTAASSPQSCRSCDVSAPNERTAPAGHGEMQLLLSLD